MHAKLHQIYTDQILFKHQPIPKPTPLNRPHVALEVEKGRLRRVAALQLPALALDDGLRHLVGVPSGHVGQGRVDGARLHLALLVLEACLHEEAVQVLLEAVLVDHLALVRALQDLHGDAGAFDAVLVVLGVDGLFFLG